MIHVKKKVQDFKKKKERREPEGRRRISERKGLRAKLKRHKMERTEKSPCRLMLLRCKSQKGWGFFF